MTFIRFKTYTILIVFAFLDCGDPAPNFGTSSNSVTTFMSTTTISCNDGYEISGTAEITCQADGTWSATPTCDPSGKYRLLPRRKHVYEL